MTDRSPSRGDRPELTTYLADFGDLLERTETRVAAKDAKDAEDVAGRAPRRWRLRPLIATAGLALAGLAAAFLIAPAVTPVDPVDEARAALGDPGDLVHFVVLTGGNALRGSDAACMQRRPTEVWQATSGTPRWRVVQPGTPRACGVIMAWDGTRLPGRSEVARHGDTLTSWYPQIGRRETITKSKPPPGADYPATLIGGPQTGEGATSSVDPIQRMRRLLDRGILHEGRRGRIAGRDVVHLVGTITPKERRRTGGDGRFDLAVDAKTFAPVRFTTRFQSDFTRLNPQVTAQGDGWTTSTTDFVAYDRRPMTADAARALTIRPTVELKTDIRLTAAELDRRARSVSRRR